MPCISSIQWIQYVEHCPRNSYEWDVRANVYNCSSSNQTCVSRDMFLYHCVLNADGTKLLEVCAPYRYINGQKCTEFDSEGPIIQENSNTCSNGSFPCPKVYISTDAYKYQSCYERVQFTAKDVTTNEPTDSISKNSLILFICIITTLWYFILVIVFYMFYCTFEVDRATWYHELMFY